jgi:hypothetical protein
MPRQSRRKDDKFLSEVREAVLEYQALDKDPEFQRIDRIVRKNLTKHFAKKKG